MSDDDNRKTRNQDERNLHAPEPPNRQNPGRVDNAERALCDNGADATITGAIGNVRFQLKGAEFDDFKRARSYTMVAQIVALVSLFIGGVLASAVAVGFAIAANGKLAKLAAARPHEPDVQRALMRSGVIVIVLSAAALLLNAISIVYLYPYINDILQSGSFGSVPSPAGSGSGSVTWG